jgi:hypothetical protein
MIVIFLAFHYFKTDARGRGSAAKRKSFKELAGAMTCPMNAAAELPKMSTLVHTLDARPPSGVLSVG